MKEKLRRVRKYQNLIDEKFGDNIIYRGLTPYYAIYDRKVAVFKLSHAEIFYGCVWVLDALRRSKKIDNKKYSTVNLELNIFDGYRSIAPPRASDESINKAIDVIMECVRTCINAYHSKTSRLPDFTKYIEDLEVGIDMNGGLTVGLGAKHEPHPNSRRYWNEKFVPHLKEYMVSDLFLSEEVDIFLDEQDAVVPSIINTQIENAPSQVGILPKKPVQTEETGTLDVNDEDNTKQFTNRQLAILFETLLDLTLVPGETNISAFAELLSRVSGRSKGSIRNKIPSSGINYDDPSVVKDTEFVASCLEKVSPKIAKEIRENL